MTDSIIIVQFVAVFVTAIFFSIVALQRQTILSQVVAAFLWVIFGGLSFVSGGEDVVSISASWVFGLVGFLFAGSFIYQLIVQQLDAKHKRFEVGPF